MPAVVSVEAKLGVRTSSNIQGDDDDEGSDSGPQFSMPDLPPDSPFRQFFEQFRGAVSVASPYEFRRPRGGGTAQGSGFFISDDGYVVTNNHVVKGASEVTVKLSNDGEFKARIIGTDPKTDLALLKVESDKRFAYVNFAAKEPRVGDWVIAVGNPFGLGGTVTTGIVSARGRNIGNGPYDDFLQIDAPINRGNSGGPAFNLDGEVIGINTAIFSPSGGSIGIGFAIPAGGSGACHRGPEGQGLGHPRLARRADPAGHRRDRRKRRSQGVAGCAGRRRDGELAGTQGRHQDRRCDRPA